MAATVVLALALTTGLAALDPVGADLDPISADGLFAAGGKDSVELLVQYAAGKNTPPIDLLVNGEVALLGIGAGVGHHYTDGHRYYTLPAGEYTFAAQYTSDQEILAQKRVRLEADRRYILFAMGRDDEMLIRVVDDELPPSKLGVQQVRFIHMTVEERFDVEVSQAVTMPDGGYERGTQIHPQLVSTLRNNPGLLGKLQAYVESGRE